MLRRLQRLMRGHRIDAAVALRGRMIYLLASDPCVSEVAARLAVDPKTVREWRDRFLAGGINGLYDNDRVGRPRRITEVTRCELIAMACSRPAAHGVPYRQTWTFDTLHAAFRARRPEIEISRTSVLRVLTDGDLRPHRMQVWLHSEDPDFRAKTTEICNLYLKPPPGSVVLSIDEKTGMQALKRKHPTKWAGCGRAGRREFEYKRNGTCTLFAAFNTQTGHVVAEISKKRKGKDLLRFMKLVAKTYPKVEVHVVWDNLNIHFDGAEKRWTKFNERNGGRFHFHYTPLHASWVNQVELFFSRVQKRVLRYGSFDSVQELGDEVLGFIRHWNQNERKPYRWTFRGYPLDLARSAA
jgi:transposase